MQYATCMFSATDGGGDGRKKVGKKLAKQQKEKRYYREMGEYVYTCIRVYNVYNAQNLRNNYTK